MKVSDIIAALPTLSDDDRRKIMVALQALGAVGIRQDKKAYDPAQKDWLLNGIHETLVRRGHLKRHDRATLARLIGRAYQHFPEDSIRVRDLLLQACAVELTSIQRNALGRRAAEALELWLARQRRRKGEGDDYDFSAENMLKYTRAIPAAFEFEFPGYLEAGIVSFMLPKTKKGNSDGEGA